MSEHVVQFGERRRLVGTLTDGDGRSDVAFVFLNAGVISRVGPQRLNVRLARAIAAEGYTAFRFDLSGLGESRAATGRLSYEQQAVKDVRDALDFLAQDRGAKRFVLVGLCSGADNAFAAAVADPRVAGVLLLDPPVYPTMRSRLRAHGLRLLRPGRLAAVGRMVERLRHQASTWLSRAVGRGPRVEPAADDERIAPSAREYGERLDALVARGVAVYLMYSGSVTHGYNYDAQFADVFGAPRASAIDVEYHRDVNHTHTEMSAQRALVERLVAWANRRWPIAATG